jgi:hypothetical protein
VSNLKKCIGGEKDIKEYFPVLDKKITVKVCGKRGG